MNKLIEALNDIDFSNLDIDELLDGRDSKVFDAEWMRVYNAIESLKKEGNGSKEIRETVFKKIYSLSGDGELAEYISDDFGLIADAEMVGYKDAWLDKLITCYIQKKIPSGKL